MKTSQCQPLRQPLPHRMVAYTTQIPHLHPLGAFAHSRRHRMQHFPKPANSYLPDLKVAPDKAHKIVSCRDNTTAQAPWPRSSHRLSAWWNECDSCSYSASFACSALVTRPTSSCSARSCPFTASRSAVMAARSCFSFAAPIPPPAEAPASLTIHKARMHKRHRKAQLTNDHMLHSVIFEIRHDAAAILAAVIRLSDKQGVRSAAGAKHTDAGGPSELRHGELLALGLVSPLSRLRRRMCLG